MECAGFCQQGPVLCATGLLRDLWATLRYRNAGLLPVRPAGAVRTRRFCFNHGMARAWAVFLINAALRPAGSIPRVQSETRKNGNGERRGHGHPFHVHVNDFKVI